jgi:PEGA domain
MDHDIDRNPAAAPEEPSASLRIEFRSSDPQLRASFRQAIVAWLTGADGGLSRALGLPEGLAVDEPGEGGQAMEVRARWWQIRRGRRPGAQAVAVERIVFAPEASDPVYRELPPVIPTIEAGRPVAAQPARLPAAALSRFGAMGRTTFTAVTHMVRRTSRASSYPLLTVRLPVWHLRPAAVILSALTVVTAGLTYGAIRAEEVHPHPMTQVRVPAVSGVLPLPGAAVGTTQTVPRTDTDPGPVTGAGNIVAAVAPLPSPASDEVTVALPVAAAVAAAAPPAAPPAAVRLPRAPAPKPAPDAMPAAVTRRATAPLTGSLAVTSTPAGAEVSINGVARGRTPVVISGIPAGSRVVRLELEGYRRWSWAVTVTGRARTPLEVRLQPDAPLAAGAAAFER